MCCVVSFVKVQPFYEPSTVHHCSYANYYYEDGVQHRDLIKAYGLRFIINVEGQAGKFDVVPLVFNIGSGLALLAIVRRYFIQTYYSMLTAVVLSQATVLCDFITIYLLKKGYFYRDNKYLYVQNVDAVQVLIIP